MQTIEIFIACIICGFALNNLLHMSDEEFHDMPYVHYWIILDCLLTFLTLGYVQLT